MKKCVHKARFLQDVVRRFGLVAGEALQYVRRASAHRILLLLLFIVDKLFKAGFFFCVLFAYFLIPPFDFRVDLHHTLIFYTCFSTEKQVREFFCHFRAIF